MRAVRSTDGGVAVVDVAEPAGTGVLVDVAASGICGTDLGFVAMGPHDFTFGHEFAGFVEGVAYAVEPTVSCGGCVECVAGHTQRCVGEHGNLGIFMDGGMADRVRVPYECLVELPPGLSVSDACLVEPAAVAWHGLRRADIEAGERIAVVGGGSIGLLAVAAAREMGHDVDLEVRHSHQRLAGEGLGAGVASGVYDVVIDGAGSESGLVRAAELARPGGRVIMLGVYHGVIPVPGVPTLVKELAWIGAMAYERHDGIREVDEVARMLAARPQIAETVITHRFPMSDAREAFRVAGDRSAGSIKVVLEP